MQLTSDSVGPSPTDNPPSWQSVRLWMLLAAHVILGLFLSIWAAIKGIDPFVVGFLPIVLLMGILSAQSSLLALWAAFASAKWWLRLLALVVGTLYLEFLLMSGSRSESISWLIVLATCGVVAVSALVRWWYAELRGFAPQAIPSKPAGLKFSIWGLMVFTLLIAIAIIGVEKLREIGFASPQNRESVFFGLCLTVNAMASIWAALGLARPLLRSLLVLLIATGLGVFLAYALGLDLDVWKVCLWLMVTMLLHAGVLLTSLLVVRSCGYRLIRKSKPDVELLN